MNNLVSSNPFKTYIGTIRVRKKNPHGFQLVFQSPCPRSFFKQKQTKPTHFTVEKKISRKKTLPPSLSRNETLSRKLSDSPPVRGRGLLGGLEAYSPANRGEFPSLRDGQKLLYAGWKVGYCDSGEGDVLKKNFPWKTPGFCQTRMLHVCCFFGYIWRLFNGKCIGKYTIH